MVEVIRLGVTLLFTAAGYQRGVLLSSVASDELGPLLGATLGAAVGYVVGGVFGRLFNRQVDRAADALFRTSPGPELFASIIGGVLGALAGGVIALPFLLTVADPLMGSIIYFLVTVVAAALGSRVLAARWNDLLTVFGLRSAQPLRARRLDDAPTSYLLDSSAAIDGRVIEMFRVGVLDGDIWIATDVVDELQGLADSGDPSTRRRGRRGLEVLHSLRGLTGTAILDEEVPGVAEVDARLVELALRSGAHLVTLDGPLAKNAELRGVRVINPAVVAESLKPVVKAGEEVTVHLSKEGTREGQAVGYLDDGTMVVVEDASARVGEELAVTVTSTTKSAVGQLLFARPTA